MCGNMKVALVVYNCFFHCPIFKKRYIYVINGVEKRTCLEGLTAKQLKESQLVNNILPHPHLFPLIRCFNITRVIVTVFLKSWIILLFNLSTEDN